MLSLYTCFSKKQCYTYYVLKCGSRSVFELTPRFARWWKTQRFSSAITDSTRPKKPWHPSKKINEQINIKTRANRLVTFQV